MTPDQHDPQLSAEDEERVRRALAASAPGPTAMPHDVAARLDDVLARLVAERRDGAAADGPAVPHDTDELAARRRRRLGPRLLVAAASVAALAVGSGVMLQTVSNSGGGSASSAGVAAQDKPAPATGDPGADSYPFGAEAGPGSQSEAGKGSADQRLLRLAGPLPRLRTASLDEDLRQLADRHVRRDAIAGTRDVPAVPAATPYPCALPAPVHGGRLVAVRLDGKRATLMLGPVRDGAREARVYACGDATAPVTVRSVPTR